MSGLNLSDLLTVAAGLFGLSGLAGGTFAVFRSKLLTANQVILRETNKDLSDRVEFLEAQDKRKEADLQAKETALAVLKDTISGRIQLQQIMEAIKSHDDKLFERDRKLFSDLESILEILGQLKDKVSLRDVQ